MLLQPLRRVQSKESPQRFGQQVFFVDIPHITLTSPDLTSPQDLRSWSPRISSPRLTSPIIVYMKRNSVCANEFFSFSSDNKLRCIALLTVAALKFAALFHEHYKHHSSNSKRGFLGMALFLLPSAPPPTAPCLCFESKTPVLPTKR